MDGRDPIAALRACIAAVQGEKVQLRDAEHEGGTNVDTLEQCLCQVEDILKDKDRLIERLRETLEQVRERQYEEKSHEPQRRDHHRESVAMDVGDTTRGSVCGGSGSGLAAEDRATGSVGAALLPSIDCANSVRELEPGYERMTEPVYETTTPPMTSEETLPHENVPEQPPPCATSSGTQRTLTTGRHLGVEASQGKGGEEGGGEGMGEIGGEGEGGVGGLEEGVKEVAGDARGASDLPGNAESSVQEETEETTTASGAVLNSSTAPVVVPETDTASDPTSTAPGTVLEESDGYQKVEFTALYYHSATGYYYDPATQQFFAPVAGDGYQATGQTKSENGQASIGTEQSSGPTTVADYTSLSAPSTYQSGPTGPGSGQTGSESGQTSSVAAMLAAVSEQASHKCGYTYDEAVGMYYDHRYAMYYDQDSQLYYDAENGTYYEYDTVTKQYQVHSRVKLPKKRRRSKPEGVGQWDGTKIDLCDSSDSEKEEEPLEEGEIAQPQYPEGSPPPEDEWAPCLRLVVGGSECVPRGSVFVVTQEGAKLGREPEGSNPITLREVQVSKSHVHIKYSKTNQCFTLCDLGSQNGTLLNNKRLSEPKQRSKPHPLSHCDTLAIGTTSFTLHIHTGWDTCEYCRWEERGSGEGEDDNRQEGKTEWKRELNRIKKRYGLRMKDTYGEDPVRSAEGYQDRAAERRQMVGSDMPELSYPDAPPSSVHRALSEESVGHKMLKKLGWKKGEGLGKNSKGITEPVKADVREARMGLGSMAGGKHSLDTAGSESAAKHRRLVKHYSEMVARETRKQ